MKQVIFNVGGALSSYIEFDNKAIVVDIGQGNGFNPVTDFLFPLYTKRNGRRESSTSSENRFVVDQLIISHPHEDHLSAINEFDKYFYCDLLTTPNDNDGMEEQEKVNWELIDKNENVNKLKEMLVGRTPPLRASHDQNEFIYYIPPEICENTPELKQESYANNISIATFFILKNHRVFMPGDIQKAGMKEILDRKHLLKNKLNGGVDVLIAPHHGLRSSFSTELFEMIKGNKVRCINVVSEKRNTDDSRNVDTRYSSSEYCLGKNNLEGFEDHYQVKTSRGHIVIDYSYNDYPRIEIVDDNEKLIKQFLE